jgi:CheY-like chemotaxis protein
LTIETSNAFLDEGYCQRHVEVIPGQYVQIAVTDTGTGMSAEIMSRAFEPFFTTKQSGQGTGLGLSQVYGFVKQSSGHIKIYSEVGEGTTVKIYLPRLMRTGSVTVHESDVVVGGTREENILVVEDDPEVRAYVVEVLQDLGYGVLQAPDANQALALMSKIDGSAVDLLLTDIVLPGRNGRQLADELRIGRPALKVLFMTGYSRNAIVHQGRLDPGVDLIQKPLSQTTLSAKVRTVLDRS